MIDRTWIWSDSYKLIFLYDAGVRPFEKCWSFSPATLYAMTVLLVSLKKNGEAKKNNRQEEYIVEEEEAGDFAAIIRAMSLSMGDDEAGLCAELERRPCSRTARKRFTGGGPAWQPEEPHAAPPPSLVAGPPSAPRCLAAAPHAATCPGSRTPGHSPPAAEELASRRRAVRLASLSSFFRVNAYRCYVYPWHAVFFLHGGTADMSTSLGLPACWVYYWLGVSRAVPGHGSNRSPCFWRLKSRCAKTPSARKKKIIRALQISVYSRLPCLMRP